MQGPPSKYVVDLSLVDDFRRLSEGSLNELDAALLVARVVDANLNAARVRHHIKILEDTARSQGTVDVEGMLAMLRREGFAQNSLTEVDLTHSSIDWLLQQHQGLPIVVAVLVLALARRLGMLAEGINYPGHFLVRIDDALIDPLALTVVDERSLQTIPGFTKSEMLSPASPVTIAFRMLNNLKSYYTAFENWRAALLTTEYQIGMVNNDPRLLGLVYFERAEYWQGLNNSEAALVEYARCAEVTTDNELAKRANSRLDQLIGTNQGPVH